MSNGPMFKFNSTYGLQNVCTRYVETSDRRKGNKTHKFPESTDKVLPIGGARKADTAKTETNNKDARHNDFTVGAIRREALHVLGTESKQQAGEKRQTGKQRDKKKAMNETCKA